MLENKKMTLQAMKAIFLKKLGERRVMQIVLSKRPLKSETALRVKLERAFEKEIHKNGKRSKNFIHKDERDEEFLNIKGTW